MIEIKDLRIVQGAFELNDISMVLPEGAYAVLMGQTGCGKTTVIEAICGLRPVQSGVILMNGNDVTHLKPSLRGIGYVPQDGALFPTLSVARNISFSLELRSVPKPEIEERVRELAGQLGIEHLLDRGVTGLSGGESQRVALGRALIFEPAFLLLDEPLSAVDEETRGDMCDLLKGMCRRHSVTALHVTHSQKESDLLGDVQFRFEDGAIKRL